MRRVTPVRFILCTLLLSACASEQNESADPLVAMTLTNKGTAPLHCRVMFGHWVDRDLGTLAPGAVVALEMQQSAKDGALYIMRADGQRQMMIETIQCARPGAWMETFGQVDFASVRSRTARAIDASCAAPTGEGRVACGLERVE
jgi:hypothetical protein